METLNSTLGETSYRVELIKSAEEGWKRYNSVKSSTTLSSERSNALVQTKSLAHLHSTSSITQTTSPQSAALQTIKIEDQQRGQVQEKELRREIGEEKRRYGELLGVKGRLLREIGEEVRDKEGRVSKRGRECLEVQARIKQLEERIKFKK
jgi:DNA repair exonuclease SbcCD ATPase subunit